MKTLSNIMISLIINNWELISGIFVALGLFSGILSYLDGSGGKKDKLIKAFKRFFVLLVLFFCFLAIYAGYVKNQMMTLHDLRGLEMSSAVELLRTVGLHEAIETIQVNHFNTRNVINMTGMFYHCKKLTHVDVSNFDTSKVTLLNSMFYHCSSLKTVDVSNFNTSRVIGMSFMFNGCTAF